MNPKILSKNYDALTARERAALFLQAFFRRDQTEVSRLMTCAPRLAFTSTHSYPISTAYFHLAGIVCIELLAASSMVGFSRLLALQALDSVEQGPEKQGMEVAEGPDANEKEAARVMEAADKMAASFSRTLAGWELFCNRNGFPARSWWKMLPGYESGFRVAEIIIGAMDIKALDKIADRYLIPSPEEVAGGLEEALLQWDF